MNICNLSKSLQDSHYICHMTVLRNEQGTSQLLNL